MKSFMKKLFVHQRKTHKETLIAMEKVIARYVNKMAAKGWKRDNSIEFAGNNFLLWEHIITMIKR